MLRRFPESQAVLNAHGPETAELTAFTDIDPVFEIKLKYLNWTALLIRSPSGSKLAFP
jgi:hypothetical protein